MKGERTDESKVKYENIYIIIWPEERLVLNRIINVRGRINWEKISTRGKNSIRPTGEPKGSMWAIKDLSWVKETQTINGSQNNRLTVKVNL